MVHAGLLVCGVHDAHVHPRGLAPRPSRLQDHGRRLGGGVELQNKLQTKYESSAALLLLSLIQPELLLLLLPEPRSHHITLLLLDGFRSLLEGLPFLLMSLLFITRPNAFGGDATMASVLAIISMGWTVITLALKLFRLLLVGYAYTHTAEVRKELSEVKAKRRREAAAKRGAAGAVLAPVRTIIMATRSSSSSSSTSRMAMRMEAMLKGMMMATRSRMDTARRIPVLGFDTVRREILFLRADSEREYESVRVTCEREMGRAACRACARAERGRRRSLLTIYSENRHALSRLTTATGCCSAVALARPLRFRL